jgi:hypothetical protein
MDRSNFIHAYLAAFLGAVAAERYLANSDPSWKWTSNQPVEDGTYLAEKAWDSIEKNNQSVSDVPSAIPSVAVQEVPKVLQPEVQPGATGVVEETL